MNDINGGVKDSATEAMRGDLYSNWEDSVIIDIDEYNSMANELANIKSQLIQLQDLLVILAILKRRIPCLIHKTNERMVFTGGGGGF